MLLMCCVVSKVVSPEGQIYFYHKLTRITQWERPVEKADAGEEVPPVQGTVQRPGDGPILSKKAEVSKVETLTIVIMVSL